MTLRDGTPVLLRAVRPCDERRLLAAFERLSPYSRYRRFMGFLPVLSARELRYFTEVDHHRHIVAIEPRTGEGIGVALYIA